MVPKWKDSRISFRNVYVSRRPNSNDEAALPRDAGQRAAARLLAGHHPAYHDISYHDDEDAHGAAVGGTHNSAVEGGSSDTGDDGWTTFDLEIDSVDVTLSFARWLDGRGLIKDAVVKGVRGIVGKPNVSCPYCCINPLPQTVAPCTGTPRSTLIRRYFDIPHNWEILNSTRFKLKTCWLPFTNPETLGILLRQYFVPILAFSENNGYFTTCCQLITVSTSEWNSFTKLLTVLL